MYQATKSFRALRSKHFTQAHNALGRRGFNSSSKYDQSLSKFRGRLVPIIAGAGLAWLGYNQLKLEGQYLAGGEAVRKAFAEASEEDDSLDSELAQNAILDAIKSGALVSSLQEVTPLSQANSTLRQYEGSTEYEGTQVYTCTLPSNSLFGEDRAACATADMIQPDGSSEKVVSYTIFDGHAGSATAQYLQMLLIPTVHTFLAELFNGTKGARPKPSDIEQAIAEAFLHTDAKIMTAAEAAMDDPATPMASVNAVTRLAPALSGSCALYALFEPSTATLRVATVGDSRAVLGRSNGDGTYSAMPLSVDQTGFNPAEVARVTAEHPSEDKIFDEKSGRLFGLAVSRAFGDARWKWSDERMIDAKKRFWSHGPRPNGVVKTPPYLTAKPEITETKINVDQRDPEFLIMASDGFWDYMSNENAVLCVQKWIEAKRNGSLGGFNNQQKGNSELRAEMAQGSKLDQDLFYNEAHGGDLEWRIDPKHFVAEDDNCATHLVRNVLGGKRRSLFCGILGLAPPLSRDVRDDITIHVIFFGDV